MMLDVRLHYGMELAKEGLMSFKGSESRRMSLRKGDIEV